MDDAEFEAGLAEFASLLGSSPSDQAYRTEIGKHVGTHPLDLLITRLADFYGQCDFDQKEQLRQMPGARESWAMLYPRRMALQVLASADPIWLVRALNIASLENGGYDYRDSIVSLVLVRAAAEQAGIDPAEYFNAAIADSDQQMRPHFENARDHRPSDVRDILRYFGPTELKPRRKPPPE